MSYDVVLFDLDHTLFDSVASEREAYGVALSGAGVEDPGRHFDQYHLINTALWGAVERGEISVETLRVRRFVELAVAIDAGYDAASVADVFSEQLGSCGAMYPGAVELLGRLRGLVQLGLVTNGVSSTQRARIERGEVADFFDAVAVSSELGVAKPSPVIFDHVLGELGSPNRSSVLMVGDSLTSDIAGAHNSGLDSCWFNPDRRSHTGPHEPHHEVASLDTVEGIVRGCRHS